MEIGPAGVGQQLGKLGGELPYRGRILGQIELAGGGIPPLDAVLPQHHQALQRGVLSEVPQSDGRVHGTSGDDRHVRAGFGEGGQTSHCTRISAGGLGVVHERGDGAVEVGGHQSPGGVCEESVKGFSGRAGEIIEEAHGSTVTQSQ